MRRCPGATLRSTLARGKTASAHCAGLDLVAREQLLDTLEHLGRAPEEPTLILVTHHLQEIMPAFTHALLLKEGRCLAQGDKAEILRSETMSEAFGIPVRVNEEGNRYCQGYHTNRGLKPAVAPYPLQKARNV